MREIKFRAWINEEKKMRFVSDLSFWVDKVGKNGVDVGIKFDELSDTLYGDPVTEYILMQYTGLHDKNGKEIYEGDILSEDDYNYPIWVVWACGAFSTVSMAGSHSDYIQSNNVVIIGNVYEHPNLLEVK